MVLCMTCGDVKPAKDGYAPAQLKKKLPKCRACTGGSGAKMHAQATGGHASKAENARAIELKSWERCGAITDLKEQVSYELVPKQEGERPVSYVADFQYKDQDGNLVVEDAKGFTTPEYVIKRKLMLWRHGIRIVEIRVKRKGRIR